MKVPARPYRLSCLGAVQARLSDPVGLSLGREVAPLDTALAHELARLGGQADRYQDAFVRASRGDYRWVDGLGIDSRHAVWMQLHEDLLATLGLERGPES